jgi:hypothetical protein
MRLWHPRHNNRQRNRRRHRHKRPGRHPDRPATPRLPSVWHLGSLGQRYWLLRFLRQVDRLRQRERHQPQSTPATSAWRADSLAGGCRLRARRLHWRNRLGHRPLDHLARLLHWPASADLLRLGLVDRHRLWFRRLAPSMRWHRQAQHGQAQQHGSGVGQKVGTRHSAPPIHRTSFGG